MHTYRKSANEELWTVGYWRHRLRFSPSIEEIVWEALSDHPTEREAMLRVNFLNGGSILGTM